MVRDGQGEIRGTVCGRELIASLPPRAATIELSNRIPGIRRTSWVAGRVKMTDLDSSVGRRKHPITRDKLNAVVARPDSKVAEGVEVLPYKANSSLALCFRPVPGIFPKKG